MYSQLDWNPSDDSDPDHVWEAANKDGITKDNKRL